MKNTAGEEPGEESQNLGTLTADISGAKVRVEESAIFTLEVRNQGIAAKHPIQLYKDVVSVGRMHDDGKDGDAIALDGIYSLKTTCSSNREGTENFQAVCGSAESNTVEIQYFGEITEQDRIIQSDYAASFQKIEDTYTSTGGAVNTKKAIEAVYQKALEGQEDNVILTASKNENGVAMQFASGIWYVYQPEQEGIDAAGSEANVSIMTLQPYDLKYTNYFKRESKEATDDAARKITKQLKNYTFDKNYDDNEVTLDAIKSISSNQVVLCHTHGGYDLNIGSFLCLGQVANSSQLIEKYKTDLSSGRVVLLTENKTGVTGGFITKHCGRLNNTFLYLGAYLSGKGSRLAQSFLN